MSQRHIRNLLKTKQTLDDSDGDDAPSTMQPKESKKRRGGQSANQQTVPTQPAPAPASAPKEKPRALSESSSPVTSSPVVAEQQLIDPTVAAARDNKLKAKAENRRRKQEKEEAEERLLAEVEAASASRMQGGKSGATDGEAALSATDALHDRLLRLLTCCNAAGLNTRAERIKSFGADSVEDVGDGPVRRNGAGTQSGILPARPPGFQLPKFRESPLSTPNRYNWPNFSSLGVTLREFTSSVPSSSSTARLMYVDWEDKEFRAAQANFDTTVASMGDVNHMLQTCFAKYPYHLPTLLQLHRSFAVTGDAPNSQLMLDMALYTVGVLIARFGLSETPAKRQLPYSDSRNRLVFETLKLGVQLALKRGCNRTAFNIQCLLLSLDGEDPCGALLSWDYLAIRSREWKSLLEAHVTAEELFRAQATQLMLRRESSDPGTTSSTPVVISTLASLYFAAPGSHFCAALAKFLTEEAEEQNHINRAAKKEKQSSGNGVEAVADSGSVKPIASSKALMAKALLRFPHVAWMLVEKLELDLDLNNQPGWATLLQLRNDMRDAKQVSKAAIHVGELFVERCYELFKTKEASRLLMVGANFITDPTFTSLQGDDKDNAAAVDMFQLRCERELFACDPALRRYRANTKEDVLGEQQQRIPQELLNPAANADEFQRDAHARELEFLNAQGLPQSEIDALQRFEAVFGPQPIELPLQTRLQIYEEMLDPYREAIGNDTNPVALFLQTLMPWNNLRDMALQRAMQTLGIDDPVQHRNAERRNRDEQVWREAAEEAQRLEDEASSSSEGEW